MIYYINLQKGEVWSAPSLKDGHLKITSGVLWVTRAGCAEDLILQNGSLLFLDKKDTVIEALEETRLEYVPHKEGLKKKAPKGFSASSRDINP